MPIQPRHIITLLALFAIIAIYAVPARKDCFVKRQPDGSTIVLRLHGDENYHYLTDSLGNVVTENEQGWYRQTTETAKYNKEQEKKMLRREPGKINYAQHGLIILANFSDLAFLPENDLESMLEMFCSDDYTYNGATGSVRQYFSDQSSGKYIPQFDVVGPITLPNTMAHYGGNNRTGEEPRAHIAIRDACRMVDTLYDIDFAKYDNDNDGIVDFVYLIYAGHNEAEGASSTTIWPHSWNLMDAGLDIIVDGKQIGTYACSSELRDAEGTERAGIGTFCHEFSHVLGLPDLYSTDKSTTHHTLGAWDIMDYGSYNNDGRTPPAYSAYERFYFGWSRPVLLNSPNHYVIHDIINSNACAMITQHGESNMNVLMPNPSVFYLLENRQQISWDTYLPGHGLMITKIQYDADLWLNNMVNNDPAYMGVDIIEAGGKTKEYKGSDDDLFPAGAVKYVPYTFYPVLDIEESEDGIIMFRFMSGGNADEPIEINDSIFTDLKNTSADLLDYDAIDAIYSIDGQIILTSPSKTAIQSLQHGIYIAVMKNRKVCKISI